MKLSKAQIKDISFGAVRCDGTVNLTIELNSGEIVDLYSLSLGQADSVTYGKWTTLDIPEQFLSRSDEQFLSQNGVK
jgi:hypothetical protein